MAERLKQPFYRKQLIRNIFLILAGNLLVAFAVVFFVLPLNILSGGTATLAMAICGFFPSLSRVVVINILTIGLFIVGWLLLGKSFAAGSLLSSISYPIFLSMLSSLDTKPFSHVDPLLAALYSGVILGIGLGLVFRANASTGGMDVPALLMHRYMHLPLSQSVMIVDALTVLLGLYVYGLNSFLIGLLGVAAQSYAINWMSTAGSNAAKNVLIISDRHDEIEKFLLEEADRGVTVLEASGAYTNQKRPVLMCVIPNRDYSALEDSITALDKEAFIIVTDVHEVRGRGFTYPNIDPAHPDTVQEKKK